MNGNLVAFNCFRNQFPGADWVFDNGARGILVNVLLGAIFGLANNVEVASPDIW